MRREAEASGIRSEARASCVDLVGSRLRRRCARHFTFAITRVLLSYAVFLFFFVYFSRRVLTSAFMVFFSFALRPDFSRSRDHFHFLSAYKNRTLCLEGLLDRGMGIFRVLL